jgi:prepilin-type N-terminal cleavage/methylation domain-containing protein
MSIGVRPTKSQGFSLIEVMVALMILSFGLLSAGQLLNIAASSGSLARSKGTAALAAQNKLESLSSLYSANPSTDELTPGTHGPQETEVFNPIDAAPLNKYSIAWAVRDVLDPRPGKAVNARLVTVTVTPIRPGGEGNSRVLFNKVVNVATVFSPKIP